MPGAAEPTDSLELRQLGGARVGGAPTTALARAGDADQAEGTARLTPSDGVARDSGLGASAGADLGGEETRALLVPRQAAFAWTCYGRPFGSLASMPAPPGGAAPAEETVRILEIAGALLADETVWDRSSIRTDGPVNGRYTLYSALGTACHQISGRYLHRHPALEAVRAEIEDRVPGRRWKHRLAELNAEASFEDVKAVLTSAIPNVA
jgi:hypothetical protein